MAFKIGSTNWIGGTNPVLPLPTSTARGAQLMTNGTFGFWSYPGETVGGTIGATFETRTLITHGYQAGGYKGGNPWRSVNKTWHSTDITVYCGEQLQYACAYQEGYFSDYNGYVTGAQGGSDGSEDGTGGPQGETSNRTVSVNLHTGMGRSRDRDVRESYSTFGFGSGQNESGSSISQGAGDAAVGVIGGWNGSIRRNFCAAATNQMGQVGYVAGGNLAAGNTNTTDKMHFGTEIMYSTTASPANGSSAGCSSETRAYWSFAGTKRYMPFSNDTFTAFTSAGSPDGWGKFLCTKKGFSYIGTGTSSLSAQQVKFNEATAVDIGVPYNRVRTYSEENNQMGQEWGYTLGTHDGQQTNHTIKTLYSNDAMYSMGSATRPKGHFGTSSGVCWSAAASVTQLQKS
jgi:hypothetical protein